MAATGRTQRYTQKKYSNKRTQPKRGPSKECPLAHLIMRSGEEMLLNSAPIAHSLPTCRFRIHHSSVLYMYARPQLHRVHYCFHAISSYFMWLHCYLRFSLAHHQSPVCTVHCALCNDATMDANTRDAIHSHAYFFEIMRCAHAHCASKVLTVKTWVQNCRRNEKIIK